MKGEEEPENRLFRTKSHLFCNLCIFFSGLMIFFFIPLFILTPEQAQQSFNNGRGWRVAQDITILSSLYFLAVAVFYWIFAFTRFRQFGAFIALFSFLWVVLGGFLLPLTTANGTEELGLASTRTSNLFLILGLSVIIAILWLSKHAKVVSIFIGTFLAISIIPSVVGTVSTFKDRSQTGMQIPLSQQKNLVLISFDGVPGHIVTEILSNNPTIEDGFKDFKYFKNVSSSASATRGSILGVMYGNHDIISRDEATATQSSELFVNDQEKYNFITGAEYSRFNNGGKTIAAGQFGVAEQRGELYALYRSVMARVYTKFGVIILDILESNFGPKENGKFYETVLGVDTMTEILEVGSDKPSIFYAHFIFTHFPAVIDQDCSYRGDDYSWFGEHQNRIGVLAGATCGLAKFNQFIEKLKSLGVYDNSAIIFASDHGKPANFYSQAPHNLAINNHKLYGFDRYQPMLMIKDIGQVQDQIEYSERYVILDDLAQTTCKVFDASQKCTLTPGLDLFDDNADAPDDFFIHVAKDENTSWRIHTMKTVKLPREMSLEQAMRESPEIELSGPEDP